MLRCCGVDAEFVVLEDGTVRFFTIAAALFTPQKHHDIMAVQTIHASGEDETFMSEEDIKKAVRFLFHAFTNKYIIVTWSGTDSDWRNLHNATTCVDTRERCVIMAKRHVDLAYLLLCDKGYMTGLDVVASHTLSKRKPMDSAEVCRMWASNKAKVLELVKHDAVVTCELYLHAHKYGTLQWTKKSGMVVRWDVPKHRSARGFEYIKTVAQARTLPLPPHTWHKPITRESCVDWVPV